MSFKRVFPFALALLIACSTFALMSCGSKSAATMEITKVTRDSGETPQVGVVNFPHSVHEKENIKCIECHHKFSNDERSKVCAECHVGNDGMNTMHELCLDCHLNAKKGPRQCSDCHIEQVAAK